MIRQLKEIDSELQRQNEEYVKQICRGDERLEASLKDALRRWTNAEDSCDQQHALSDVLHILSRIKSQNRLFRQHLSEMASSRQTHTA
jgi:hypothetical protein